MEQERESRDRERERGRERKYRMTDKRSDRGTESVCVREREKDGERQTETHI